MKLYPWIGLMAAAALLASCDQAKHDGQSGAPAAATPVGPPVERAGPVTWDAATGAFQLNGKALKAAKLWTFDGSTEGFTAVKSTLSPAAGQGLAVTVVDPTIRSTKGLNIPGGQFSLVLVRLTRTAPGTLWDGAMAYTTPTHAESANFLGHALQGANPAVNETTTLIYDMSHQAVGGQDWMNSTIDQIRFDLEDKPGGKFVIHQIAIAENPDPAALAPAKPGAPAPATPAPPAPKP